MNIKQIIEDNGYKLLGEIQVSEEEYLKLKEYAANRLQQTIRENETDLDLALAFVQIAIRHYEGNFWDPLFKELNIRKDTNKQVKLGHQFLNTLKTYSLLQLPEGETKEAVENIKFHTIFPEAYGNDFCDFLYGFFVNNLHCTVEEEDFDEIFESLSNYLKKKLNDTTDRVSSNSLEGSKIYELKTSSKKLFAYIDTQNRNQIFLPLFKFIEKCYYDEHPNFSNRLEMFFYNWYQKESQKEEIKSKSHKRSDYYKKPYLLVDFQNQYSQIIIPQTTLNIPNVSDCVEGEIRITVNNKPGGYKLNFIENVGSFISEEITYPILNDMIFEKISIDFIYNGCIIKTIYIPQSDYRIIDSNNKTVNNLSNGESCILIKKGIPFESNTVFDIKNTSSPYWDFYSTTSANNNTICKIGNDLLSSKGIFKNGTEFGDYKVNFTISKNNENIKVIRRHPKISFNLPKDKYDNTYICINEEIYKLTQLKPERSEYNDIIFVNLSLQNILYDKTGYFEINIIDNQLKKHICNYFIIDKILYNFDLCFYIEEENGKLEVLNKDYNYQLVTENIERLNIEGRNIYTFPINNLSSNIDFSFELNGHKFILSIPIPLFKYGKNINSLHLKRKGDYLWYKEDSLVFCLPEPYIPYKAFIKQEKMDTEFKKEIEKKNNCYDIEKWNDARGRIDEVCVRSSRDIKFSKVLYKIEFTPSLSLQFDQEKQQSFIEINNIVGNASLYVDIIDMNNNQTICEKHKLEIGKNYIPGSQYNGKYNLIPYMDEDSEEHDDILGNRNFVLLEGENKDANVLDIYPNWKLVEFLSLRINYDAEVHINKKEQENTYLGYIELPDNNRYNVKIIKRPEINTENKLSISIYFEFNGSWVYPYIEINSRHLYPCQPLDNDSEQMTDLYYAIIKKGE